MINNEVHNYVSNIYITGSLAASSQADFLAKPKKKTKKKKKKANEFEALEGLMGEGLVSPPQVMDSQKQKIG